jgi:hypothetical protein
LPLQRNILITLQPRRDKKRVALEVWRDQLENRHPFVVENGGGILIPAV